MMEEKLSWDRIPPFDIMAKNTSRSDWREAWDDFRTAPWINIIKYPESFIQQGIKLLSIVNVQV